MGKTTNDDEIIASILKGEEETVLTFLYKNVLPKVKSYILKNKGSYDDAKDAFQDAVIILYRKVKQKELPIETNIASYTFVVARNIWIARAKHLQKYSYTELNTEAQSDDSFINDIITEEKGIAIKKLLSYLGSDCQRMLEYLLYDNLTTAEICDRMGFSNDNVTKVYLYRCKKKLTEIVLENKAIVNLLKND